jgi:CheY-like chemotaxis protein
VPSDAPELHGPLIVLVAEDNPTIQILFQRILETADCQVTLTSNGEEAVAAARERRFDLCLMDLRMPKMDGFAAVRAIRGLPHGSEMPIYAVSADVLDGQEAAEATDDFDGFLPKPLRPDLILGLVGSTRAKAA